MPEDIIEAPEFTDEQLRAALRGMGREARAATFAAGRPVFVIKGRALVRVHPDGSEETVQSITLETDASANGE
jgi:hypothetical protein